MPRGKQWTLEEIARVWKLKSDGKTQVEIANVMGKTQAAVSLLLKKGENFTPKTRTGRKKKTTCKTDRRILRIASKQEYSLSEITKSVNNSLGNRIKISKWTVRRRLLASKHFKYSKMKKTLMLKQEHKDKRLEWAKNHMAWTQEWSKVIFSDEKKINLDGPDGMKYYWHDLRKEPRTFFSRNFGGGSLVIWGSFCKSGKSKLAVITTRMTAVDCADMLCEYGLPFFDEIGFDDTWTFQHDNARPHSAQSTVNFLETLDIRTMNWPPYSPDLNPIENLWGILAQKVYANGRQYNNIEELKSSVLTAWDEISPNIIDNLINSMPARVFELISKNGGHI